MPETIDVELTADTQGLETTLKNLEDRSRQFGSVLTSALKAAVGPVFLGVFRTAWRHPAICQRRADRRCAGICRRWRGCFADLFSKRQRHWLDGRGWC